MRFGIRLTAGFLSLSMLASCTQGGLGGSPAYGGGYGDQAGGINKATIGTVGGAGAGALLGAQVGHGNGKLAAVAIGTLLGAAVGNGVGSSLDKADLAYANRTTQTALEQGQPGQAMPWSNPQSGVSGTVVPQQYYQTAGGQYCREYTQTIIIGGQKQQGVGRACRQPDGTWQVVQ